MARSDWIAHCLRCFSLPDPVDLMTGLTKHRLIIFSICAVWGWLMGRMVIDFMIYLFWSNRPLF